MTSNPAAAHRPVAVLAHAASLTVNPSLTIAALAERASASVAARCAEAGIALRPGVPVPGNA